MTAAAVINPRMDSVEVLFMGSKSIIGEISGLPIILFTQILDLIKYLAGNINSVDRFVLIVPSDCIDQLRNDPIYIFRQTRKIYIYYDNDSDLNRDKARIQNEHEKLVFCYKRNLSALVQKFKTDTANSIPGSNSQATVYDVALSYNQRLLAKRSNRAAHQSTTPKRVASSSKHGFPVTKIEQVYSRHICPSCNVLFRDPHQLECGHRICKSCIKVDNK
jgi:hypothetical protein